jgi:hypothetical protein
VADAADETHRHKLVAAMATYRAARKEFLEALGILSDTRLRIETSSLTWYAWRMPA